MKFEPREPLESVNTSRHSPLLEALRLVVGVAAVAALGFAGVAVFVDVLVPRIPVAWESALLPDFLVLADEPTNDAEEQRVAALRDLLSRLASHWPENPYELGVGVLEDEQPNALALPGGRILVTTGLLELVQSENELALVLGHELGHFRSRDHLRQLGRGLVFGLMIAAVGGAGVAGSHTQLFELAEDLALRSFSRGQEAEADAFGLRLVREEYGTVVSAWDFFERLRGRDPATGGKLVTYLSTHPLSEDRIEALERLARERGWSSDGQAVPLGW